MGVSYEPYRFLYDRSGGPIVRKNTSSKIMIAERLSHIDIEINYVIYEDMGEIQYYY